MSETKEFTEFVCSMRRLYQNNMIPNRDKYIEGLLSDKKITLDDYLYIVNGKEV